MLLGKSKRRWHSEKKKMFRSELGKKNTSRMMMCLE